MCYTIDMTSSVMEQRSTPVYDEYVTGGVFASGKFYRNSIDSVVVFAEIRSKYGRL